MSVFRQNGVTAVTPFSILKAYPECRLFHVAVGFTAEIYYTEAGY